MHTETAYQAWSDLEGRYKQKNASKTNQIKYQLSTLQQGSLSVIEYFDKFKALCENLVKLDHCEFCPNCKPIYEGKQEEDIIHQFLLGLNEDFMTIRTQLLSQDQVPSMSKVFCLICQEERQKLTFREKGIGSYATAAFAKKNEDSEKQEERGMYSRKGKKTRYKILL